MKVVIQRCQNAHVSIDSKEVAEIEYGLVVLIGIGKDDNEKDIDYLIQKIINMRIFSDKNGKMNLSVQDVNGGIILVSQFTLFADTKKGKRPSFIQSAPPQEAEILYNLFVSKFKSQFPGKVETGQFGADMKVSLINDGPVTIIIDSNNK